MSRSTPSQLNTKLDWLKERTKKTMELALEKVVAHHDNPGQYPLPGDAKSLERALNRLFQALPAGSRRKTIDKVENTLKAGSAERNRIYGDLAGIDLRSAVPVVQQVKALPVASNIKFTQAELDEIRGKRKAPPFLKDKRASRAAPAQAAEAAELAFVVQSVTCVRPTDLRKDEVSLAGFATDDVGGQFELAPFFVGKFKKGETLALGGNGRLFNFKLTEGEFPKTFLAGVFIVEKDLLRNSDFVNALITFCVVATATLAAISVTMLIVGLAGGPFSAPLILGSMAAQVVLGASSSVLTKMIDDVSFPAADALTLEAPVAPGTTFDRTFNFEIGDVKGQYQAAVRWVTA
jgi:hypothetical protein